MQAPLEETSPAHDLDQLAAAFQLSESSQEREDLIRRSSCIAIAYLDLVSGQRSAGRILQRCKRKVQLFRASVGEGVCVFKIGYSSNPILRFASYRLANFSCMTLLHVTECRGTAEMLEAALIDVFWELPGCRNEQPGGEGPRHLQADCFYVYVVGARAHQPKPIGG